MPTLTIKPRVEETLTEVMGPPEEEEFEVEKIGEKGREENPCRHHWLIETPHGPTSMGKCKRCGNIREFRNSASDIIWEGEPTKTLASLL